MTPIGPIVTLAVWAVIVVAMIRRDARDPHAGHVPWFEVVPIVVGIAMIQLLLDLHIPWLGDAIAIALHAIGLGALWLRRRAQQPR